MRRMLDRDAARPTPLVIAREALGAGVLASAQIAEAADVEGEVAAFYADSGPGLQG